MKKAILAVLVAGSMMSAVAAHAADGTVHFNGNIVSDACTIDASGQNLTVNMGDVATAAFSAVGDKASPSKFSINVTDCPDTVKQVSVKFDGTSDSDNTDLLKLDSDQTAKGVAIEIASDAGTAIPLHSASPAYTVADDGSATLDFVGRYVSTAATVEAGTANATSQFTINYQ